MTTPGPLAPTLRCGRNWMSGSVKFGSEKCGSIQKYPKVDELMIHHRFGSKNLMSILMDHFFMERQEGDMCVCVFCGRCSKAPIWRSSFVQLSEVL